MNLYDDDYTNRSALAGLVESEGKEVVLVLHSYGGMVGTEAVQGSLGRKYRKNLGLKGGVGGLFYMCALILPLGQSLMSRDGGHHLSVLQVNSFLLLQLPLSVLLAPLTP